ncbi:uncharacterized protein METZ01_LOCUS153636, partial [marine metagenome]
MAGKTLRGSTAARDLGLLRRYLKVTTGEIADLAGKDPSAVSHWRKGKRGFPEPVVGGRSPLFRYDEVHDWLGHHDKLAHEPDAVWLWRKSVQALHESTGVSERSRLRGYVTAMVVVLPDFLVDLADFVELLETGGFDQWLAETDRDLDADLVEFLRDHLTDVEPDREILRCAARAFRYALDNHYTDCILLDEALDALNVLSPVQTTTSEPVVALISELIGNLCDHGGTVADLACGEATLLTSLLEQDRWMGEALALDRDDVDLDLQKPSDSRFLGIEIDRDTAAIAHIRLMLHNSPATADWHIQVGNSLAVAHEPAERFDTVILDPPTTKTKAWLNLASKSLTTNPASRAFVLLPSSALAADGPCASLLRERRLEAIVHLPNRFKKNSRGLVLCLITGESTSCKEILYINLADLKIRNPSYGPVIPLSNPSADSLPAGDVCAAISHWRDTQTINEELLPGVSQLAVDRGTDDLITTALHYAEAREAAGESAPPPPLDAPQELKRRLTRRARRFRPYRLHSQAAGTNPEPGSQPQDNRLR